MSCDVHNQDQGFPFLDHVNHAVPFSEPGGPVAFPFSMKSFVMESLDKPYAGRARDSHDVLPFLISLEDFLGEAVSTILAH